MQNAISHSSVSIRSIQMCMCAFALPQEQKRNRFGTVAFDVHRMFHHDETALTTRASGLGWTSAGLPHMQEVHSNWRTNPVKPSNPLRKLTHTIPIIVSCIPNSTDFCFCPPQCGLYGFRDQNKVERLSPVDPGISREVTDLYPPRGYTHPVIRAIKVSHAACKAEFRSKTFWSISQRKCIFHLKHINLIT